MKSFRIWAVVGLILAIVGAGGWAWWNYDLRWRPKVVDKHQREIVRILESSGWSSPGLRGKRLYMVAWRGSPTSQRFAAAAFPKLHAAGVDTRVIVIARPDLNGQAQSTAAERATVAQIWLTHDWRLMQTWTAAPPNAWRAPGIPPADGDMARTAVVEAGRRMVDDLRPLLRDNGIRFAYPVLVWWDNEGRMRACACDNPKSYSHVLSELGAR
jgi:hypothetical protein